MTDLLANPPSLLARTLATEQEAREVAEAAREKEWEAPSFVREMFEGSFRLDLVHPYPSHESRRCARPPVPSWSGSSGSCGSRWTATTIDREGKIPADGDRRAARARCVRHQDPQGVRRPRIEPDELHPRDRHGDQRGRQPHRAALRRAVDRRAAAAQDLRHAGAEDRSISPAWPRARSRPSR